MQAQMPNCHRILLAEDDERLAVLVKDYLESTEEFLVEIQGNGNKVIRSYQNFCPHLVILDVNLPHKDGMSICKELRVDFNGPILMLTARNTDADQILGLEYGADDYVIKPVEPRVLLARIRALLRRVSKAEQTEEEELAFGNLSIHCDSRNVTLGGEPVNLSTHEYDLLLLFAREPSQIMSRELLFNTIYARPYDGLDRTIDVRISQLRKKLGDHAEKPYRIKTVWGRGYMFVPDAW